MSQFKYLKSNDVHYPGVLSSIKKAKEPLQPIFEAFTNAIEAIPTREDDIGYIKITLAKFRGTSRPEEYNFDRIIIEDNGVGFNDKNFERFTRFRDDQKGYNNKGIGRIQFLHFFQSTEFISIYKDNGQFFQREFETSKSWLNQNAITRTKTPKSLNTSTCIPNLTKITFRKPLLEADEKKYAALSPGDLKRSLISHYMLTFCIRREKLPKMEINQSVDEKIIEEDTVFISSNDIPQKDQEKEIILDRYKIADNGEDLVTTGSTEKISIAAFKAAKNVLDKNEINLTCKGEIAQKPNITFEGVAQNDIIEGNRYLFLLSGDILDRKSDDVRNEIAIPTRKSLLDKSNETGDLFDQETILIEDIQTKTNEAIDSLYIEIKNKKQEKELEIEKLQRMFLLDSKSIKAAKTANRFNLDESDERILEKVYSVDIKLAAQRDAVIKRTCDRINQIDLGNDNYSSQLDDLITDLAQSIQQQNRAALTRYVARRKIILELFGKLLEKELRAQKEANRNINEKLIHNVLFQQGSDKPEDSALWLINEDFIYFNGVSEKALAEVSVNGKKLFKEKFTEEEEKILTAGRGKDRRRKRPDVLLFPDEGKCILIEFKNPAEDVSDHLAQISKYAGLIMNFSGEEFGIETFYGYLIGEEIEPHDVTSADSDFLNAYHFDYLYRPRKRVLGNDHRRDGSLYTEVIKYSTLLKRAIKRNEIFIKKLTDKYE